MNRIQLLIETQYLPEIWVLFSFLFTSCFLVPFCTMFRPDASGSGPVKGNRQKDNWHRLHFSGLPGEMSEVSFFHSWAKKISFLWTKITGLPMKNSKSVWMSSDISWPSALNHFNIYWATFWFYFATGHFSRQCIVVHTTKSSLTPGMRAIGLTSVKVYFTGWCHRQHL